jgi:hypothetical protein
MQFLPKRKQTPLQRLINTVQGNNCCLLQELSKSIYTHTRTHAHTHTESVCVCVCVCVCEEVSESVGKMQS